MKAKKIYFDMDCVLADFNGGLDKLCGFKSRSQDEMSDAETDAMWAAVRDTEHFYDRLDPMPGAVSLFNAVYDRYGDKCEILSAIPKPKRMITGAGEDKIKWVHRILSPDIKVNIVYKEEKKDYCTGKDCILIDDLQCNIDDWEAYGGTGILHESSLKTTRILEEMGLIDPQPDDSEFHLFDPRDEGES